MGENYYISQFTAKLNMFKKWLGGDLEYYLINTSKPNGETYCDILKLTDLTENVIKNLENNLNFIDDILYVLAIDNEVENIKDYIIKYCSDELVEKIVSIGYNYYLYEARWQIAVIIKERYLPKYEKYLEFLRNDTNLYVRKRAE